MDPRHRDLWEREGEEPITGVGDRAIRPARPEDAPRIWELVTELAAYERLSHTVQGSAELLAESLFGPSPAAEALVAEVGGEVVGYAIYFTSFSTFAARPGIWLDDVYVRPGCRGMGLGKAIICELARLAERRGCARFEWVVLDWNEPSIRFYEALGARLLPEWQICRVEGDALRDLARADLTSHPSP